MMRNPSKNYGNIEISDEVVPTLLATDYKSPPLMVETYEVRAVGRERTEAEKKRRHLYGDKGAKFSGGKQLCILGDVSATVTTFATKDCLVAEIYD